MRRWDWDAIAMVGMVVGSLLLLISLIASGIGDERQKCRDLLGQAATARDTILVIAAKASCSRDLLPTPPKRRNLEEGNDV